MNAHITTAVILAGGAGFRLRPLTNDLPKAMMEVQGRPLLEWIINWLKRNSVYTIIIGVAYHKEAIIDYFGNGKEFDVNINYSEHTVEGGTGEGFRLAIQRYVDDSLFIAMNGDEITNINVHDFCDFHVNNGGVATIALSYLRSPFGTVEVNNRNDIVSFIEKPLLKEYLVSMGVYLFQDRIREYLPSRGNIESTTFLRLAAERKLKGYLHKGFWGTVNTLKDLQELQTRMPESL
jgi:NDP-sugar pyrophosphorylase family protein